MATKKQTILGSSGRQAAYTQRKRAALILAAQEVLANIGPNATIEQIVNQAQVSPNTIYNHFESKEDLLSEALSQIWQDWLIWAYDGAPFGESLQTMITVCRKLFLVGETHPLFSRVLKNTLENPDFVIRAVKGTAMENWKKAMLASGNSVDFFETRVLLWAYSLAGIMHAVYVNQTLSPKQADEALELSFSIWGLSPAKARKLVSQEITKK